MSDNNNKENRNNPFESKLIPWGTIKRNGLGGRITDIWKNSPPQKMLNRLIGSPLSGKKASLTPEFKCIVASDLGVGELELVQNLERQVGTVSTYFDETTGENVPLLGITTNCGRTMKLSILKINGLEPGQLRRISGSKANCAIIVFKLASRSSYTNVQNYYRELKKGCGTIPMIVCGTKSDNIGDSEINQNSMTYLRKPHVDLEYFQISSTSVKSSVPPILSLTRKLLEDENLEIKLNQTVELESGDTTEIVAELGSFSFSK